MTKKILVPLDGSPTAETVLPLVIKLAQADNAEVELVTVLTPVAIWDTAASMIKWDAEEAAAREYIEGKVKVLTDLGLRASAAVAYGEAAPAIFDRVKASKADLVAITTHGRSGLARWFLGSVAEKLLHSKAPMLVVHPRDSKRAGPISPDIGKILVPLDGSELARAAIAPAEKMAKTFNASLVFCTVVTTDWVAYAGLEAPAVYQDVFDDMKKNAQENLEKAAAESRKRGFQVECFIGVGVVSDEIQRVAREQKADLIVLSTHGRSGPGRWVMGSTADALVRRSHLPCLLVRSPGTKSRRKAGAAVGAGEENGSRSGAWTQAARLSAAAAFVGLPLSAQSLDEPQSVDLPALDTAYAPVATVAEVPAEDVDAFAWMDAVKEGEIAPVRNFAVAPGQISLPGTADAQRANFLQRGNKNQIKPRRGVKPHEGGWYRGGQR
jgi:nucleotide-binding universal stress UspA family protein